MVIDEVTHDYCCSCSLYDEYLYLGCTLLIACQYTGLSLLGDEWQYFWIWKFEGEEFFLFR
jgi:hypothetical protein